MERRFVVEAEGLPDLSGMMLVTIEALKAIGGSATKQELEEKVAELEGVSEEEQSFMMAGTNNNESRLNYYLSWARTYLKRGLALENSARAIWTLTEKGAAISAYEETKAIHEQVTAEERERARQKRLLAKVSKKTQDKPAKNFTQNSEVLDVEESDFADWKSELLETLKAMDPSAFERLAQRLLREAGFSKVEVRGKSGDGGIDGVGVLSVNLVSFQVFFQCKRYKGNVSASEVRDFRGAMMGRADKGLFITTGGFTAQARDEATRDGATAIDLIDGERLCNLLKNNTLGVSTKMVEQVLVDPAWFRGL